MSKTFDLSTLNLSAGTHEITVKARASGYTDSPASNAVSYTVQIKQLNAPTISLNGNILTILSTDDRTKTFAIFDGGTIKAEISKTTNTEFDLSTLSWTEGTHYIRVRARASSYVDSVESNAVSYVVAGADTVQVSGTWRFNYSLALPTPTISTGVDFINYEDSYGGLYISSVVMYFTGKNGATGMDGRETAYSYGKWVNTTYRIITFDGVQTVSKEFYKWLVANATRPISGIYKLNDNISDVEDFVQTLNFSFTSNGQTFNSISGQYSGYVYYDDTPAYRISDGTWLNSQYQYITVDGTQYLSNYQYTEFFAIFSAFQFRIEGNNYYAKEGMTWGEWVASEYNTGVEEGGTIIKYFVDIYGGSYIVGTNEEIPIGAILRSSHGGGVGYVVRLNGVCVLNTDTIMPTAYEEVKAGRN